MDVLKAIENGRVADAVNDNINLMARGKGTESRGSKLKTTAPQKLIAGFGDYFMVSGNVKSMSSFSRTTLLHVVSVNRDTTKQLRPKHSRSIVSHVDLLQRVWS